MKHQNDQMASNTDSNHSVYTLLYHARQSYT